MKCSRCGKPATTKRDNTYYCGSCSLGLDWGHLIRLIQDAHVEEASSMPSVARSA